MLHCHEEGIDDDAESDEEVDKGIHDEEFDQVRKSVPALATLPSEEKLMTLGLEEFLFTLSLFHAKKV